MDKYKSIVLWLTNDCNLRCKYCYARAGEKKDYMDFEMAKKALDLGSDQGFSLQFAGGEALLNYDLIEKIYIYIRENRLKSRMSLQTNGILIDEYRARSLKKMGVGIGISLDGPREINDFTRGRTIDTIRGIEVLSRNQIKCNLNMVVTNESIEYLPKLVDMAFYFGNINAIGLDLLRKTGRYKENQELLHEVEVERLREFLIIAYERSEYYRKKTGKHIVLRDLDEATRRLKYGKGLTNYCHAEMAAAFALLPNGDLYPCSSLIDDKKYYMGNILSSNIEPKKIEKNIMPHCEKCEFKDYCPRGCPSRMILNQENDMTNNPDCLLKLLSFQLAKDLL